MLCDCFFIDDINGLNRKNTDDGSQASTRLDGRAFPSTERQRDASFGDAIQNSLFEEHCYYFFNNSSNMITGVFVFTLCFRFRAM